MSETENIRKNLAIERMIVEGCDILLDVNQMFVRQGTLVQIHPAGKAKIIFSIFILKGPIIHFYDFRQNVNRVCSLN